MLNIIALFGFIIYYLFGMFCFCVLHSFPHSSHFLYFLAPVVSITLITCLVIIARNCVVLFPTEKILEEVFAECV